MGKKIWAKCVPHKRNLGFLKWSLADQGKIGFDSVACCYENMRSTIEVLIEYPSHLVTLL